MQPYCWYTVVNWLSEKLVGLYISAIIDHHVHISGRFPCVIWVTGKQFPLFRPPVFRKKVFGNVRTSKSEMSSCHSANSIINRQTHKNSSTNFAVAAVTQTNTTLLSNLQYNTKCYWTDQNFWTFDLFDIFSCLPAVTGYNAVPFLSDRWKPFGPIGCLYWRRGDVNNLP